MIRFVESHRNHTSHRDPTAAEIAAWLQARPDVAVEVVGLLRVAGEWIAERDGRLVRYGDHNRPMAWAYPVGFGWCWGTPSAPAVKADTEADARAAADAALVAAGWALAGEP